MKISHRNNYEYSNSKRIMVKKVSRRKQYDIIKLIENINKNNVVRKVIYEESIQNQSNYSFIHYF